MAQGFKMLFDLLELTAVRLSLDLGGLSRNFLNASACA